jgi:hypothetical protein
MNRILVLVVLAVLGFAVAGCASGKKAGRVAFVARSHVVKSVVGFDGIKVIGIGTARFSHLKPGTRVTCKGGPTLTVPYDQSSAAAVRGPRPAITIKLSRSLNGMLTVSCGR